MISVAPPVTVIKVPKIVGSFGYGAKVEGNKIVIPYNPSVIVQLQRANFVMEFLVGSKIPTNVTYMPRVAFNNLSDYKEDV